jgi:hypothetical protein
MKTLIAAALLGMAVTTSSAWSQTPDPTTQGGSNDPIVKMHEQIAAARHVYDRKVAAAKKVFDQKKAAAAKERDAAIAIARNGAPQ